MRSYRLVHQFLFVLAFLPLVFSWRPWQLMLLLPLALVVPYGINELVLDRRESRQAKSPSTLSSIAHAYLDRPRHSRRDRQDQTR